MKYAYLIAYKVWLEFSWNHKENIVIDSKTMISDKETFTCKDVTDLELDLRHQLWENEYKAYYRDLLETNLQVKVLSITKLEELENKE